MLPEAYLDVDKDWIKEKLDLLQSPYRKRVADLIDALTNGEYKQCQNALRGDEGFCCLGVASDVFDPDGWLEPVSLGQNWTYRYTSKWGEESSEIELLDAVSDYYGMHFGNVGFSKSDLPDYLAKVLDGYMIPSGTSDHYREDMESGWSLMDMNDNGVPFQLIATVILSITDIFFQEKALKG